MKELGNQFHLYLDSMCSRKTIIAFLRSVSILALWLIIMSGNPGRAQDNPTGPIYIVKPGDSLWGIASRFNVSLDELKRVNNIKNPDLLTSGDQLVIPGLPGVEGILVTDTVSYGETLLSLSRRYQIAPETLVRLNHLTSPDEIFTGSTLVIPEQQGVVTDTQRLQVMPGQSLLELAAVNRVNPWQLILTNRLENSAKVATGDILFLSSNQPGNAIRPVLGGLPPVVHSVDMDLANFYQGKAVVFRVSGAPGLKITGSLIDHNLHFYEESPGILIAMQGIHAMTEPGMYSLSLNLSLPDGSMFQFSQAVLVRATQYPYDQPLTVKPETIDPAVTQPEDKQWSALAATMTPNKFWSGRFTFPSPLPVDYCLRTNDCWSSRYGNRRSYNGSSYIYFHTGLDIVGKSGTDIYAAADGVVVFSGLLTVRGNATMINHGWGVYTGYMHQSELMVKPGDLVKAGQLIGRVGNTGRVEGPHLHWEVWAGGVQVDPLDWLERVYP